MGILSKVADFLAFPEPLPLERKDGTVVTTTVPQMSADAVEAMLLDGSFDAPCAFRIAAVMACARVIAEGLALPPCYLHRTSGSGKLLATNHPLYPLLNQSPNERQTSYEFREMLGYHLALDGNAYVFVNRSVDGTVLELLPCDPGSVTVDVDQSGLFRPVTYFLYGQPIPAANMWHLKGPAWLSWRGLNTIGEARDAIGLASATQTYGAKLFQNAARPGAIVSPKDGVLTTDQAAAIRAQWSAQYQGVNNAHKTVLLTAPLNVQMLASNADEAQWTESRRFQIEEICRYFRVSPVKVFQQLGSQSYASVEQAHIAHDQDTDAHWHERYVQSANKSLLTQAERRRGYTVGIDNRSILRGTAGERMAYYTAGIAAGIITRNEAREMEGFDPSEDPSADQLTPAQNVFGSGPDDMTGKAGSEKPGGLS